MMHGPAPGMGPRGSSKPAQAGTGRSRKPDTDNGRLVADLALVAVDFIGAGGNAGGADFKAHDTPSAGESHACTLSHSLMEDTGREQRRKERQDSAAATDWPGRYSCVLMARTTWLKSPVC